MIDGKQITLAGEKYTLAPVPLSGLAAVGEKLALIGTEISAEAAGALVECVWRGLRRNHPEVTREFVDENIDTRNSAEIIAAFVSVNGFVPKDAGEGAAGEAMAG